MWALATRAAAIGALLLPCSLMAQEATPNIAITHAIPAASGRPRPMMPPAILPADHPPPPAPIISPSGDVAALGTIKIRSGAGEWAGGAFRLAAMRGRSAHAATAGQSFDYDHFAMMALGADLTRSLSARDTLTLAGSYAVELRRPAFIVSAHRNYRTDERAVALHWTRDDHFDLAGTLFDTGPAKHRTEVGRIADLAGGAPRAVRGWGLTASLFPSANPERLSVGIDFRDQQDSDIGHRDARVLILLRRAF